MNYMSCFLSLSDLMGETEDDLLAYPAFPRENWQKMWSSNPLEAVNKVAKGRTNVVGIFQNEAVLTRFVGAVLYGQHDGWQVSKRCFSAGSLAKLECEQELQEQSELVTT